MGKKWGKKKYSKTKSRHIIRTMQDLEKQYTPEEIKAMVKREDILFLPLHMRRTFENKYGKSPNIFWT